MIFDWGNLLASHTSDLVQGFNRDWTIFNIKIVMEDPENSHKLEYNGSISKVGPPLG